MDYESMSKAQLRAEKMKLTATIQEVDDDMKRDALAAGDLHIERSRHVDDLNKVNILLGIKKKTTN